ncbi:MAG: hypothetical protein HY727_09585 [Candidatus Rokubacteria bacterium]|nr:hypothetical protein [Candidatus Rokubacteria bacterium]
MLAPLATASAPPPSPALPPEISAAERARLQQVVENATVSTRIEAEPFPGRREVFEYLLDHPEFATHVTRTLRVARYRIWRTPEGLFLDDGWGATGHFSIAYAASGTRVFHAQGQYDQRILPSIHGQGVVVIEYGFRAAAEGRTQVTTTVTGFVKLESRLLALASKLAMGVASRKADLEARRLMKVFAKVSRALEEDPGRVYAELRQRPDVPQRELEEFRVLLNLR